MAASPSSSRPLAERVVGLDYLPAVHHPPGIGRYVRELVRALVRINECPSLRLFELGRGAGEMDGAPLGLRGARPEVRRVRMPLPRRVFDALGKIGLGATRFARDVELFHRALPAYPPVRGVPEVLPVPELPPEGSPADTTLGVACRRAARVLVFCESYTARVAERYALNPARIVQCHVGCEHWTRELAGRGRPVLPGERPTLVVLGAIRRARLPLVILAGFEALRQGGVDADLVFVGRPADAATDLRAALARSSHSAHVKWISQPVERDMPELVASAWALVHLAEDEGTPVTPLEALAVGTAVAASPLSALREALGGEATWIPEHSPAGVAAALDLALTSGRDEGARGRRIAHAVPWTWDRHARESLAVWDEVLRAQDGG